MYVCVNVYTEKMKLPPNVFHDEYMYANVYTYIHTYIQMHTYTYIHTYVGA